MRNFIIISAIIIVITSCSNDKISFVGYVNDVDNGLVKKIRTDNWDYTLQYRPAELMSLVEIGSAPISEEIFSEILSQYEDFDYYLLTLRGRISQTNNLNLISHLSFDFEKDILQVIQLDSISPSMYHFENGVSSFGEYRCMLSFPESYNTDRQILIKEIDSDRELKFVINSNAINKIPELNI